MELSRRLLSVANGVSQGNRLADVGTDHGYIPIFLVQQGRVPSAIAMDVNRGPLLRAEAHIREQGLEDKITTRLGSGLLKLSADEVDSIVIAGMGGALMAQLLEEGLFVLKEGKELILQPQSEIFKVRHWLHDHGYEIIREEMVKEDGKYYFILKAVPGQQNFSEEFLYEYGEYLLKEQDPLMKEYLSVQLHKFQQIRENLSRQDSDAAQKRIGELSEQIDRLEKAYHYGM
jgi:tRNA (adenine22-N1)-methyltransferase